MQKTQTLCLIILSTIAVGFSLYYLQTVLLPFVIALFVAFGCRPIMEYFERQLKLPRFASFGITFFIGVVVLSAFAFLIWSSVNDVSRNKHRYEARLGEIVTLVANIVKVSEAGDGEAPDEDQQAADGDSAEVSVGDAAAQEAEAADGVVLDEVPQSVENDSNETLSVQDAPHNDPSVAVQELLASFSSQLQQLLLQVAGSLSSLLSYGVLILIFVFFLLMGNEQNYEARPRIVKEIEQEVRKYLVMKTVISFFTGLAFGAVLWMFGVPLAVVFGFLAFLLNFIPNLGPLVACLLPIPFLVLNSNMSPAMGVTCFVLISIIQFVSGNVIETRLMGKTFDVSPVFLLISLMFFGLVWGIVGMFLATPIVSIIKIVLQQSEHGRPFAELMAGRWRDESLSQT